MCLIFLSINNHPAYKLIVAANRDEFYKRKTAPAHFWDNEPTIVGGRDLEARGTWMGMNKNGRISMVTNYRDLTNLKSTAPSRGQLVSAYLSNGAKPDEYLAELESKAHVYNGFNLIVGKPDELWYYSNYKKGIEKIPDGLHGLSNHLLNTPWPKVHRGVQKMKILLAKRELEPDEIFETLYDDKLAPDAQLPDTGVGLARERILSSMFIKSPDYGSRCSTIVLVDRYNHVLYAEREYDLKTFDHQTRTFEFDITS